MIYSKTDSFNSLKLFNHEFR